jgi:hypothetical protein
VTTTSSLAGLATYAPTDTLSPAVGDNTIIDFF